MDSENTLMTEDIELYNPDEFIVNDIKMFLLGGNGSRQTRLGSTILG
jgi:hypothetical protein